MVLVILLAIAVSLPVALLSLAKVLLFITALVFMLRGIALGQRSDYRVRTYSSFVILVSMLIWAASLLWTGASHQEALIAFVKHGKLMMIPILIYLVRDRRDAQWGIMALLAGQSWVLISSWLMAFDMQLPWVFRPSGPGNPLTQFVPYADSYLDQSIMLATTAGLLWHLLRGQKPYGIWAQCLALACLANVLVLMPGRTGYILAIIAACLAALFEIPTRLRLAASVLIPLVFGIALFYALPQFQQRVDQAAQELNAYKATPEAHTSVGARLNMWKLSLKAIAEKPLLGHGVGNWTPVVKRLYGVNGDTVFGEGNGSNPHQELLLWSVELGIVGGMLFLALLYALYLDTRSFQRPIKRTTRSVIIMLLFACMFNSPLYDDLMGDYFCVALGLLLAFGLRDNPNQTMRPVDSQRIA